MVDQPTGFGVLSLLVFLPLLGVLLTLATPREAAGLHRTIAIGTTLATFLVSLWVLAGFHGGTYHFQMVEFVPWLPQAGIHYRLGVDGISIWVFLLTTLLTALSAWFSVYVRERTKAYMVFLLLLETAMLGVFVSLDMILFYTFFEASLIPMYFLISIWGGERRAYASLKFFLFTFAGSIFMLVGMVALAKLHQQATGAWSFSILDIQSEVASGRLWAGALQTQAVVFWAFAVAFLVKCPAFPLHTWLPDAHTEAPTAGSIILAGVLLKMGTYGFLRFCLPLFPDVIANQVPVLCALAVIGILYGAAVSAVQPDVKRLIAYSSVAHMGFVLLGIFSLTPTGMVGGAYQQLNHGISTGALFLLVGLIYERTHTRLFKDYGGLKAQMPVYAALFLIIMLSSVGLPGTNGFVGEFLSLMGSFEASFARRFALNPAYAVLAAAGVILAAVYLLWMFQKMFYGPLSNPANRRLKDLKAWEVALVMVFVVFVFWGGLAPSTFTKPMEASLHAARMMALNPVGQRPDWRNLETEIDPKGNLVRVEPRTREALVVPPAYGEVIAPAEKHYPLAGRDQSPQDETAKEQPRA